MATETLKSDRVLIGMLTEALADCQPWLPTEDQCCDIDRDEVAALQQRVKWLLRQAGEDSNHAKG